eukprot:8042896-Prorocentrum_lima.AAC.1
MSLPASFVLAVVPWPRPVRPTAPAVMPPSPRHPVPPCVGPLAEWIHRPCCHPVKNPLMRSDSVRKGQSPCASP